MVRVQAMFRFPTGVAFGPDGSIFVADSDNHVIRRIAPDADHTVTVYAGAIRKPRRSWAAGACGWGANRS